MPTLRDYVREQATRYKVDPELAFTVLDRESRGVHQAPDGSVTAGSPTPYGQAQGMFQVLPSTAAAYKLDPRDPFQNIEAGIRNIREAMDRNPDPRAVFAYYHGGSDVAKHGPKTRQYAEEALADFRSRIDKRQQQQVGTAPPAPPTGAASATHPHAVVGDVVKRFGKEALASLNPVTIAQSIKAIPSMVAHPIDTATAMYGAQRQLWEEGAAREAGAPTLIEALRGQGSWEDYRRGLAGRFRKSAAAVPLLGPRIGEAQTFAEQGKYPEAAGAAVDVAGQVAGPKMIGKGGRVRVLPPAVKPMLNPAEEAAVALGRAENVPLDLATVTGNPFIAKLQRSSEATARGAPVARRVYREREELLPQIGERKATALTHPAPISRETAGEGLRTGTERYIQRQHTRADFAYDQLRQIEADPQYTRQVPIGTTNQWTPQGTLQTVPVMGPMQLPADVSAVKNQLRTVYDRMASTVTDVARRQASPGLTALKNLVEGPDFVPALQLERDLSAIKALGRGPDLPELRNVSQGLAGYVTRSLEPVVNQALAPATNARQLLREGREATRLKWMTEKILKKTSEEPTQAFRKATAPKDANARYLTELAKRAPGEMPKLGRALLEDIFTHGQTGVDSWEAARTMNRRWRSVGPKTREILFPRGTGDLDALFQLHEMLARTPNPSGTALTSTAVHSFMDAVKNPLSGLPGLAFAGTIAKKFNDPAWVQLLTEGKTIPAGTPRAAAWTTAAVEQLAEAVLAEQDDQRSQGPPAPPPALRQTVATPPPRRQGAEVSLTIRP